MTELSSDLKAIMLLKTTHILGSQLKSHANAFQKFWNPLQDMGGR